ncbi:hypothetical protein FKP32DRAFT_1058283 [Trametes sanguinea]|nr:hypothetical protein FKP32DRAFT_1058283 [Trametes sanguinea]
MLICSSLPMGIAHPQLVLVGEIWTRNVMEARTCPWAAFSTRNLPTSCANPESQCPGLPSGTTCQSSSQGRLHSVFTRNPVCEHVEASLSILRLSLALPSSARAALIAVPSLAIQATCSHLDLHHRTVPDHSSQGLTSRLLAHQEAVHSNGLMLGDALSVCIDAIPVRHRSRIQEDVRTSDPQHSHILHSHRDWVNAAQLPDA